MIKTYNIDIFNAQTGEFDLGTVTIEVPVTYQIRYAFSPHRFYVVSAITGPAAGQKVACYPKRFRQIAGVSDRAVLGCTDVTADQLRQIGFVLPAGGAQR